jgi:1,4-dihydroxy-2-naphthoyl-CoA hydrolase
MNLFETTGPSRSPEGCRDPRSIRRAGPAFTCGARSLSGVRSAGPPVRADRRSDRQLLVTTSVPEDLGRGFDNEIGLTYIEVTPDGGRAKLTITDKVLQPWGIVHGGVYCAIVESLASVSGHIWLAEHGGGTVVGVNNNTDFLRALKSGTVTATSTPIHRGRRQQLWLVVITDEQDRPVARGQVRLQNLEQ